MRICSWWTNAGVKLQLSGTLTSRKEHLWQQGNEQSGHTLCPIRAPIETIKLETSEIEALKQDMRRLMSEVR